MVLTAGVVQMEDDQVELAVTIHVSDSDAGALIFGAEPARESV